VLTSYLLNCPNFEETFFLNNWTNGVLTYKGWSFLCIYLFLLTSLVGWRSAHLGIKCCHFLILLDFLSHKKHLDNLFFLFLSILIECTFLFYGMAWMHNINIYNITIVSEKFMSNYIPGVPYMYVNSVKLVSPLLAILLN